MVGWWDLQGLTGSGRTAGGQAPGGATRRWPGPAGAPAGRCRRAGGACAARSCPPVQGGVEVAAPGRAVPAAAVGQIGRAVAVAQAGGSLARLDQLGFQPVQDLTPQQEAKAKQAGVQVRAHMRRGWMADGTGRGRLRAGTRGKVGHGRVLQGRAPAGLRRQAGAVGQAAARGSKPGRCRAAGGGMVGSSPSSSGSSPASPAPSPSLPLSSPPPLISSSVG